MNKLGQLLTGMAILLFSNCSYDKEPDAGTGQAPFCIKGSLKEKIAFSTPEIRAVSEKVSLTGSVEANPDKVVSFVSLVGGIVSNTYFSLGDKVRKGQLLAEMRSSEYLTLQSELKRIESQISVAQQQLASVTSMFDDGIASSKELMEAQSALDILKADKQRISANLQLYSASSERGVLEIRAMTSGIITEKSISNGTQITSDGGTLFTISDLNEVWIMVNIYATNIQDVHEGAEVEIRSLSYPGETFYGKIGVISQVYDNDSRVLKARVLMPNSSQKFKPGMVVDVHVMKQKKGQEAVSIPTEAIVFDNNENYVVIYRSDCDMQIRKIEVISNHNGTTYISGGLETTDTIISHNQLLIYEQLKNF